jgi:hypothetical protein
MTAEEKIAARAARFGTTTSPSTGGNNADEVAKKLAARAARFGLPEAKAAEVCQHYVRIVLVA